MANHIIYSVFALNRLIAMTLKTKQKTRDWQSKAKGLLKAELKRRALSYADLAEKLGDIGVRDEERNISNKIGRGSFSAVFLIQCLEAINCRTLHLSDE